MLSDEEGESIDRAVLRLKHVDSLGYDIVLAYYLGKASCRAIARELNHRPDYITACLARAEAYIAGQVDVFRGKSVAHEHQGKATITLWSALKSHFGCSYREIEEEHFTEALSLAARVPIAGEFIGRALL